MIEPSRKNSDIKRPSVGEWCAAILSISGIEPVHLVQLKVVILEN